MKTLFYRPLVLTKFPALLALLFVGAATQRASAQTIQYNYVDKTGGQPAPPVSGYILVNASTGALVGGQLAFGFGSPTPIPASAWFEPSWNGTTLSAFISGTGYGYVGAEGNGQPYPQIFWYEQQSGGPVDEGVWVADVPEPETSWLVFAAALPLAVAVRRLKPTCA